MLRKIFIWIPRLILCAIILFLLLGALAFWLNMPSEPPDIKDAPWMIQTYSNDESRIPCRVYYAADIEIKEDGTPVAKTYWSYDGQRYKKYKREKSFPLDEYGIIGITRRT